MTVVLSVHEVREHIRRTARSGDQRRGSSSSALLGRIFHEVAADLVRADPDKNAFSFLENLDFDRQVWCAYLAPHAYDKLVGPRIAKECARLQEQSSSVLHFWEAVQSLCVWLIDLAWAATNPRGRKTRLSWKDLRRTVQAEAPLEAELCLPTWTEPVLLTGIADSVIRLPFSGNWCVQEYKIGRTSPEADLAQICLYHLLLLRNETKKKNAARSVPSRSLSLVRFEPEVRELFFGEAEIASAQEKLLALIGSLAGVTGGMTSIPRAIKMEDLAGTAELGRKLIQVFEEYARPVELTGEPIAGPAFFRFPVNLCPKVKLEQIQRLGREVQVRMGLEKPPFIGVDRGRVVVDLERPDRRVIRFADIAAQFPTSDPKCGSSLILIGVDLDGNLRFADLNDTVDAHILVAGATGSGKTEWLRTAIHGLILLNTPETLRLVLIDPKRIAFNEFRGSPFLLSPESLVFPDEQPILNVLKDLVSEMDRRYLRLHRFVQYGRNGSISSTGQSPARIVCVCDEYFALVVKEPKQRKAVEAQISLLGAKARAAGIHLILATQQPSREVIKGALDSNIPARVGLMMVKKEESRMLLGYPGAENLLGKGDLLFRDVGDPVRLQAPLL
ncbi:MAG: DNA translocase FtsK [Deltaproteobacteria bacterium]|nr:DNA translocase FtsK [Deltaproteobacteria bacterium]